MLSMIEAIDMNRFVQLTVDHKLIHNLIRR